MPTEPETVEREVAARLMRIRSPETMRQVLDLALKAVDLERQRETALDTKATAFAGAVAFALTLAGGLLVPGALNEAEIRRLLGPAALQLVKVCAFACVLAGLSAALSALIALRPGRGPRAIQAADLLGDSALAAIDGADPTEEPMHYQREFVRHVLSRIKALTHDNNRRERLARHAQVHLVGFAAMGTIAAIVFTVVATSP
jgi:hypothetical protein